MARTGRPRANIDRDQFEGLCRLQCTEKEVLSWFGVTDKTLNSWCRRTYKKTFSDVFKQIADGGKISLRRTQWRLAERSVPMAIFLGKQYLGQRDDPGAQEQKDDSGVNDFLEALDSTAEEVWTDGQVSDV